VILLCSEDLRFVACGVEEALKARGWNVRVEYGEDARPWVQRAPVERPSVRILCVPGTVDRSFADKLRTAFAPEPDADLHILGVDDSRGLVQEIERLAGVRTPRRRPLSATAPLAHPLLVEEHAHTERRWRIGATAALAAFVFTLGGSAVLDRAGQIPQVSSALPSASFSAVFSTKTQEPVASESIDDSVLAAVAPSAYPVDDESWDLEPLPEEEDEIIIFDDEPTPSERLVTSSQPSMTAIGAPPLAETSARQELELDSPTEPAIGVAVTTLKLPAGFLPVGNMTVASPALPTGFMPVAGLSVTPGEDPVSLEGLPTVITHDPFVPRHGMSTVEDGASSAHDPFVSAP